MQLLMLLDQLSLTQYEMELCAVLAVSALGVTSDLLTFAPTPAGEKEALQKEMEELRQQREELDVRVSALRSQYEGRLSRQERELRDLREQHDRHAEPREEPAEPGPSKVYVLTHSHTALRYVKALLWTNTWAVGTANLEHTHTHTKFHKTISALHSLHVSFISGS